MTTTSDGDPPDPNNVNLTTNAQSPNTPAAHSTKNDSVLTTFEGEPQYFVIDTDNADDANKESPTLPVQPPTISPSTATPGTGTISLATHLSSRSATPNSPMPSTEGSTDTDILELNNNLVNFIAYRNKRVAAPTATSHHHPDADTIMTNTDTPGVTDTDTPDTSEDTKTLTSTDDNSSNKPRHSNTDETTLKWTLIKIGWNSIIPANDSIHNPNTTTNPVDDNKTSQHPFIAKLSSFISSASKNHNCPIVIKTSKSKCTLLPKDFHSYWSVNDFKHHFAYTTSNRRVQFTLWISMPSSFTLWTLKQPILGHLQDADIYIEEQTAPMDQIETTFLGWFCQHHVWRAQNGELFLRLIR